ncbi:MAG TPA: hypothetical protein VEK08_04495 [Planctomycetota bacterium]|nr:hypothetical protein [Planctomycetota bacterium]
MAGLYKKYESQGFHIIGLESQGSASDAIKSILSGQGAGYQATTGGNIKGANVTGLPHSFLFDAAGNMVADDPPLRKLEAKIKELLKESGAALAGPGPYKKLAPMAAQIKLGSGLGSILKTLATKKTSKDAEEAAEATMMYDALKNGGTEMIDSALEKKDSDPVKALAVLDKVAVQFTGDDIGTRAKTEADTLKKDPKIKKEVEADAMWKQIEKMNEGLKPVRGMKDPKDEAFRKANMPTIQGIVGACQQLNARYAGTNAAAKATELMESFR